MKQLRTIIKYLINVTIVLFITLLGFELCYRYSVIDFYKAETLGLNYSDDLEQKSADIVIFGDSFSATAKDINYIERLRELNPDKSILNFSVPGTGIRQVNTFAKSKTEKHQPKAIIYQIYVGNDLIDVNHLWNLKATSLVRNVYWEASDHFLSLSYLNRKLAMLNVSKEIRLKGMLSDHFSADLYEGRTKRFLKGDSSYLERTIMLQSPFSDRYTNWLTHMAIFLDTIPDDVPVYLLWIPHCLQVNKYYMDNMKSLGASFNNEEVIKQQNYPFIKQATKDLEGFKNVKHLNPLQYFQVKDTLNYHLYYHNDSHINKTGNNVLSDFLESQLSIEQ